MTNQRIRNKRPRNHNPGKALFAAALVASMAAGCTDRPSLERQVGGFRIVLKPGIFPGTPDKPLPLVTEEGQAVPFEFKIEALRNDRLQELDTSYEGWAILSIQPTGKFSRKKGSFTGVAPAEAYYAAKFNKGVASNIKLGVYKAHGPIRLLVTDVGYDYAGESGAKFACNNGKDDDGDGYVDDKDRGCFEGGNDKSGTGGTNATGASPPIYFHHPRIYDIQKPIEGNSESPLDEERVSIKRGWLVVTRVSTEGLYVTDFENAKWDTIKKAWNVKPEQVAYASIFAFNFSRPLNLQQGDCLVQLDGAVDEFFDYTELSKPHWKKGDYAFCAAKAARAGVPDCPGNATVCRQRMEQLADSTVKLSTMTVKNKAGQDVSVWVKADGAFPAEAWEAGLVEMEQLTLFDRHVACDRDNDGATDFDNEAEAKCMNDCLDAADKSCIVLEAYNRFGQWSATFTDGAGATQRIAVITRGVISDWDPLKAAAVAKAAGKPKTINKVVGTMRNFVYGTPPWILEIRRTDDCPQCKY